MRAGLRRTGEVVTPRGWGFLFLFLFFRKKYTVAATGLLKKSEGKVVCWSLQQNSGHSYFGMLRISV